MPLYSLYMGCMDHSCSAIYPPLGLLGIQPPPSPPALGGSSSPEMAGQDMSIQYSRYKANMKPENGPLKNKISCQNRHFQTLFYTKP